MNKPPKHEGFVKDSDPVVDDPKTIEHQEVPAPVLPDEPPAPPKDQWPVKVKLMHKPVITPTGDVLRELTFREPTGGDINRYGNPCHVNQEGDVIILEKKMTTMMAVLSGVLQPFLEGMDPRDWNSCAYRLRGFFLPNPAAW